MVRPSLSVLQINIPERDDIVICPLCFKYGFTAEAVEQQLLTLEHVPPDALLGKPTVLTCRTCNNNQGSKLDAPLAGFISAIDAINGTGEGFVDASVKTEDGGNVRIGVRSKETHWRISPVLKASHAKHLKSFGDQFEQGRVDKITLEMRIPNPRRAMLGLLRAAYLLAFAHMGYGFLVNVNLGRIRYQLQHPEDDIFPLQAIRNLDKEDIPDEILGVNIIREPEASKSYFIVLDIQRKGSIPHRVGVMLPGPNTRDYSFFEHLKEVEEETLTLNFEHYGISFGDKLKYPFLAHDIWNDN